MTTLQSLVEKLTPLGLYNLESGSNISCELASYAFALDKHRENIEKLLEDCFISTSDETMLAVREKYFGNEKSAYTLSKRRQMLINRSLINDNDFTRGALAKIMSSIGVESYYIVEEYNQERITVYYSGTYSETEKKWIENQIVRNVPAHLEATVVYRT